ncbi:MAG: tRNA (guanosine(37)-N1)-methyltransferase TrmD [Phycisphaerales bacterium]|nr:tRNA (guanosine(37)-N1)-methyltransferase TrmD [Phycisphaerae bacterium]NNF41885.1 tRNA (guanosine(37)-N1)-methyltransferase TrmD [Phycisphaerales bacterium]NNM25063.1 tRNA (guanosine(37)-N1)-methyltransferase TrmD [Phycisphaerales bacterium]
MRIDILTLFPAMLEPILGASILGRAATAGRVGFHVHDIREHTDDKHRRVDDRPFGGGPGMVMMCQPIHDCVQAVEPLDPAPATRILLSPQGTPLTQAVVERLARLPRLLLIAGHYEGVDERVIEELAPEEISVGDFVLSGGELPALLLVDAVVRLIPGVLGHADSAAEDSFSRSADDHEAAISPTPAPTPARGWSTDGGRLLDCPHYTRPRVWRDRAVPEVLLSGDHEAVARWRRQQMIERTQTRRPDLMP